MMASQLHMMCWGWEPPGFVKLRVFWQARPEGSWEGSQGDTGQNYPNSLAEKEGEGPGELLKPKDKPPGP